MLLKGPAYGNDLSRRVRREQHLAPALKAGEFFFQTEITVEALLIELSCVQSLQNSATGLGAMTTIGEATIQSKAFDIGKGFGQIFLFTPEVQFTHPGVIHQYPAALKNKEFSVGRGMTTLADGITDGGDLLPLFIQQGIDNCRFSDS